MTGLGEVAAFEPFGEARENAVRRYPTVQIREGRLPDAVPFAPEAFDLVAALDVGPHHRMGRIAAADDTVAIGRVHAPLTRQELRALRRQARVLRLGRVPR